jgi:hypothetical protein
MTGQDLRVERIRWGDPRFAEAKRIEYEIFGLANDFASADDTAAGEIAAYRPWERSSEFYVGYDRHSEEPIAVVRMLRHDPALGLDSFSTLRDFRRYRPDGGAEVNYLSPEWDAFFTATDPGHIAELATQAVLRPFRGPGVIEQMWRELIEVGRREDVRIWTVALVLSLFRWYSALLPDAVCAIGRPIPDYVGADSIPAMIRLDHPSMTAAVTRYDGEAFASLVRVAPERLPV